MVEQTQQQAVVGLGPEARGVNVGLRARRICSLDDDVSKSLSPCGLPVKGKVLANHLGQLLLSGGLLGDGTAAAEIVRRAEVIITEGDVDFLACATVAADSDELAPAVFGIGNSRETSGSWIPL